MADWVSIKAEYVATDISTRALAEKWGVCYSTLEKKARKEKWTGLRQEQCGKVAASVRQKMVETVADDVASYAASIARLSMRAVKLVDKSMANQEEKADPYKVKALVSAVRELAEMADKMVGGKTTDTEDLKPLAELLGEPDE